MLGQAGQILLSRITWVGNELVYVEILRNVAKLKTHNTLLLFKKFLSERRILMELGLEPTSPCSREEITGALDHSATMTC